jgi:hypothetical protein
MTLALYRLTVTSWIVSCYFPSFFFSRSSVSPPRPLYHHHRNHRNQYESQGRSVDRLGEISRNINQEVKEQNVLLDHLDREVNDRHWRLDCKLF